MCILRSLWKYLQRLSDELCDLAVLRVFVPPDDELDCSGSVSEDWRGVGLRHTDQRLAVNFDDLIIHLVIKNKQKLSIIDIRLFTSKISSIFIVWLD